MLYNRLLLTILDVIVIFALKVKNLTKIQGICTYTAMFLNTSKD